MSFHEQLELIAYIATKIHKSKSTPETQPSLKSMIGTGKGCFSTPEAADIFISKEREKWQS